MARIERTALNPSRIIDSLTLARRRHPAGPNSLDALCSRYGIDSSSRTVHGALVDAQLLAEVYIELIGGRQTSLQLGEAVETAATLAPMRLSASVRPQPLPSRVETGELADHRALRDGLKDGGIWSRYLSENAEPATI